MHAELVRTQTRDGLRLDGALAEPILARSASKGLPLQGSSIPTAAILLHGVAGNFYNSSTFESVIPRLLDLGLVVLTVNTRGHDSVYSATLGTVRSRLGAAYETVDDCRADLAAWIAFLVARGHQSIVLIGHSLGAIKAVYSQALEKSPHVAAVIAISPPRLSYAAFMNAPESSIFFESFHAAEQMVNEGRGTELFNARFPFPILITAAGYIDKYGPAERYNLLRHAGELSCPALFLYGGKELTSGGIAFAGLPEALLALPNADRRSVAVVEEADHMYTGRGSQLADQISAWLQDKELNRSERR